jgi:aminoglycoside phosphotransferase (APT) family kinase protein
VAEDSEAPEGIDGDRVGAWLEANVAGASAPFTYERIAGGRSNLTYRVADSAGHTWALRRPPMGKALGSAHDMGREHRVVSALAPTPVPVAPIAGYCTDEAVNEAPFYVMDFIEGPILRLRADAVEFG